MRRVKRCFLGATCAFMLCSSQLVAASKPHSFSVGEHLVDVVPMVGAGTYRIPAGLCLRQRLPKSQKLPRPAKLCPYEQHQIRPLEAKERAGLHSPAR